MIEVSFSVRGHKIKLPQATGRSCFLTSGDYDAVGDDNACRPTNVLCCHLQKSHESL